MNSLWIVILSVLTTHLAYNLYARRIDRNVVQPDDKRATRAFSRRRSLRAPTCHSGSSCLASWDCSPAR